MKKRLFVAIIFLIWFQNVNLKPLNRTGLAETISLQNPSFEGAAGIGVDIPSWSSHTFDSTPDLLPGAWGELHPASKGATCLGLVVRKDGSTEDIGQKLSEVLESGVCYKLSMDLSKASSYAKHHKPARIRVWGGKKKGAKEQLLFSTPLISHTEWKTYSFRFTPKSNLDCLTFEAFFAPGTTFYYNGNILLDNLSVIEKCIRA